MDWKNVTKIHIPPSAKYILPHLPNATPPPPLLTSMRCIKKISRPGREYILTELAIFLARKFISRAEELLGIHSYQTSSRSGRIPSL